MKKFLSLLVAVIFLVGMVPAMANDFGFEVPVDIETEEFLPLLFMCDSRLVLDDNVEPGRMSDGGEYLWERTGNYAFINEQIEWLVLGMDKNKVEDIEDVFAIVGSEQDDDDVYTVECVRTTEPGSIVLDACNARIDEEELTEWDANTMSYYTCRLTVPDTDDEEYWVSVEAIDATSGDEVVMDENEYWFFNPIVALTVDNSFEFEDVRPGTMSYSDTVLVSSDTSPGSGVKLDLFISGVDFTSSYEALCLNPYTGVQTNQLILGDGYSDCDDDDPFCYFASKGAYSTEDDDRADDEGYVGINYGDTFGASPQHGSFYGTSNGDQTGYELLQDDTLAGGADPYFAGNVLGPEDEFAVTLRLNLPEPCMGDFDVGGLYFWGEAI